MKTSSIYRFIAMFIVVTIFTQLVPVSAVQSITETFSTSPSVDISEETVSETVDNENESVTTPEVVNEDESKRQASVKHFLMEDGSYTAVDYGTPVHYYEEEQWKDIDNTLVLTDGQYSNTANDFEVDFANNIAGDKLVSITKDNYSLSWQYVSANNTSNILRANINAEKIEKFNITSSEAEINSIENVSGLSKVKDGLKYRGIDTNVDIEYELGGNYVKENIVINSKLDSYVFGMQLFVENVTPILNSDGTISFMANEVTDTEVFRIPKPFMYDGNGVYSDAVTYSLQQVKGIWLLSINADATWINSSDRVFPVTVDPVVEETMTESSVTDVTLSSHSSYKDNTTLNSYGEVYVGYDPDYGQARALIHFDIPDSIPEEAYIFNARYFIVQNYYDTWDETKPAFNILVYEADKDWVNNTSLQTWNGYYGSGSTTPVGEPIDYIKCGPLTLNGENVYYGTTIDVTEQMQRWLRDDGASNKGIMLMYENDSVGPYFYTRFFTPESQSATTEAKPRVQISYWDTTGLNDFNTYKSYTLENSGTLYINEGSGSVTYLYNDFSVSSARLSPVVNHVFNHIWVGLDGHVGKGFGLNIREYVAPVYDHPMIDQGYKYQWRDEDGSWIYFKEMDDGAYYVDEVGRGLKLTRVEGVGYFLKDKSGNTRTYTNYNAGCTYMTKIEDSDGNTLQINYSSSDKARVASVTDSAGNVYPFTYSNGNLINIKNPAGDILCSYTYDSSNMLTAIHNYETGCDTYFTYDGNLRISTVSNGYMAVRIEYNNNWQVVSLTEVVGTKENKLFTASYLAGRTEFIHQGKSYDVTAADAIKEVCVFNEYGQKITNYLTSKDGSQIYGVATSKYTNVTLGTEATEADLKKNNKLVESNASYESVNYVKNPSFENGIGNWVKYQHGDNTASVGASTEDKYIGQSSFRFKTDTALEYQVDYFQDLYLSPGTYTVSAYVKAVNYSGRFVIDGQIRENTIALETPASENITTSTDENINFGWKRISFTATITETTDELRVRLIHYAGSTGTIYVDGVFVEKSTVAGLYNYLENSGFETDSGWTGTGTTTGDGYTTANKLADSKSYVIKGGIDKTASFYQVVNIGGADTNPSTTFNLSGWAKASSAGKDKSYLEGGVEKTIAPVFKMSAICTYSDGTESTVVEIDFNKFSSQWQYAEETFNVAKEGKTPVSIKVICEYSKNIGSAYFDNLQLTHDTYVKTEYDDNGNVKKSENEKGETVEAEYDSENNVLTEIKDINGITTIYSYDAEKPYRLVSTTDYKAYTENKYDQYGNVTQSVVTENKIADYGIYYITAKTYKYNDGTKNIPLSLDCAVSDNILTIAEQYYQGDQQFRVIPAGNGYYIIMVVYPAGKTLTYSSTSVTMTEYTGADDQLWKFEKDAEGAYKIIPKADEAKCVTVSETNGSNVYFTNISASDEGASFNFKQISIDESIENVGFTLDYTDVVVPNTTVEDGGVYFFNIKEKNLFLDSTTGTTGSILISSAFSGLESQRIKVYGTDTENVFMMGPVDNENLVYGVSVLGTSNEYVTLQEKTGADTQLWYFWEESGRYIIHQLGDSSLRMLSFSNDDYKVRVSSMLSSFILIPVDGTGNALRMGAKSEYSDTGMYVETITDERGNVTYYDYNENTGRLTSETDVTGNVYNYIYGSDNSSQAIYLDADKDGVKDAGEIGVTYNFNDNRLVSLIGPSTEYAFSYNNAGLTTSTGTSERTLATYSYENDGLGRLSTMTYGNGVYVSYEYDYLGRTSKVTYTNGTESHYYEYTYANSGSLAKVYNSYNNVSIWLLYDAEGNVYSSESSDGELLYTNYDEKDRVTDVAYSWNGESMAYEYNYKTDEGEQYEVDYVTLSNGDIIQKQEDGFERPFGKTIFTDDYSFMEVYYYLDGTENYTTNLVETFRMIDGYSYFYTYDSVGNITSVTRYGETEPFVTYEYDNLNQLTRENNKDLNKTWVMTYDNAGNILSKNEYVYTTGTPGTPVATMSPTYSTGDWKDLMTGLNGNTITYDAIGNPLTYYNGMNFTWQDGRKLSKVVIDENRSVELEYNSDGLLVKKTYVDLLDITEVTEYFYTSGVLQATKETWIFEGEEFEEFLFWYIYDDTGEIVGFRYNNTAYYYSKNLQGDVLAIYKEDGTLIGRYDYDAWGRIEKITNESGGELTETNIFSLMILNPIRYRSYYYDMELGMYYLTTRYYDPYSGRFLNADGYLSTGQGLLGNNMFSYCENNPVVRIDDSGLRYDESFDVLNPKKKSFVTNSTTWTNNTFGAGSSTTATIAEIETPILPDPLPITVKTGVKTTQIVSQHGDSSKPISVYANKDAQHPIKSSSVGININIDDFTLNLSVGLDDIGIYGSLTNDDTINSFGVKLNLSELKIGFESSTSIQWDNTTETAYTNSSLSGWAIVAAYLLITSGQPVPNPSYAY